jgi:hypothetical protein
MIKQFLPKELKTLLQQLSPSMLLLSLAMHGFVLLMPLSSSKKTKLPRQRITTAQPEAALPSIASIPHSTELFSEDKALVKPRPINPLNTNNPQFTAQLPSLPPGSAVQTSENLLPVPTLDTPQASPVPNPIAKVIPTPVVVTTSKKQPAKPTPTPPIKKSTPTSNSSKPQKVTVSKNPDLPKKPDIKAKPIVPAPITIQPTQVPESLPSTAEEQAFDRIFVKLDEEIGLTKESNSEPEQSTMPVGTPEGSNSQINPKTKKILGTATDKIPEELITLLQNKLETQGFKVSRINTYAGGLLYVVIKGKFTQYMTLTPNQELTGTIISTWSNPPGEVRKE